MLGGGQDHHRKGFRALIGADAAQHLQAVYPGQVDVQQDQGRNHPLAPAGAEQVVQRLLAIPGHDDCVGDLTVVQAAYGEDLIVGVVFHEKDGFLIQVHVCSFCTTFPLSGIRQPRSSVKSSNGPYLGRGEALGIRDYRQHRLPVPCRRRSRTDSG